MNRSMENDDDHEEHKAFHSTLHQRAREMLTKIESTTDGGRSLDSLITVIHFLGKTNKDAVKVLRRSKKDIYQSRELTELLIDCFKCSQKTLGFLNALDDWLTGITLRLGSMKTALHDYKTKTNNQSCRVLLQRRLGGFMEATNTQTIETLLAKLTTVLDEQHLLKERLQAVNHHKSVPLKTFRKVSTVILALVYTGLVVCAVVSAVLSPAMVIPPLAVIAVIANMNPIDRIEEWMNHILAMYEDKLRLREEMVNVMMEARTRIAIKDLESIRFAIEELQEKIQGVSSSSRTMVKEMENKIDEFARVVTDLNTNKDKCYKDVRDAQNEMIRMTSGRK